MFYGGIHLAGTGMTPRHLAGLLLFIACVIKDRKIHLDKIWLLYFVFIFFFFLCTAINNHSSDFFQQLFSSFTIAYIAYWATIILVREGNLKVLLSLFVIVGLIDGVTTIFQALNITYYDTIMRLFLISFDEVYEEDMLRHSADAVIGFSIPGLFNSPVVNGYFLMTASIFSLTYQKDGLKPLHLIPFVVLIVSLFMAQQRSPFFLGVIFTIYIFVKIGLSKKKDLFRNFFVMLFLGVVAIFGLSYLIRFSEANEMRYADAFSETGREGIYGFWGEYLLENIFFPDLYGAMKTNGHFPHNLFYNMLAYGGLFGFIALLVILFRQLSFTISNMLKKYNKKLEFVILACAFLAYIANSLTHNASIANGDSFYWILWAAVSTLPCAINKSILKI